MICQSIIILFGHTDDYLVTANRCIKWFIQLYHGQSNYQNVINSDYILITTTIILKGDTSIVYKQCYSKID